MKVWLLAIAVVMATHVGWSAEAEDRDNPEWAERVMESTRDWLRQHLDRQEALAKPEPLGKTLLLTFEIVPREKPDDVFSITTATDTFRQEVSMQQEGSAFHFAVEGRVHRDEQGNLLVAYQAEVSFAGGASEAQVELQGSTQVTMGKAHHLAQIGDKKLTLTVSEVK